MPRLPKKPDFIRYNAKVRPVDKAGRLVLPAEVRRALGADAAVLVWFDGKRLHVASTEEAARNARSVWKALGPDKKANRG